MTAASNWTPSKVGATVLARISAPSWNPTTPASDTVRSTAECRSWSTFSSLYREPQVANCDDQKLLHRLNGTESPAPQNRSQKKGSDSHGLHARRRPGERPWKPRSRPTRRGRGEVTFRWSSSSTALCTATASRSRQTVSWGRRVLSAFARSSSWRR